MTRNRKKKSQNDQKGAKMTRKGQTPQQNLRYTQIDQNKRHHPKWFSNLISVSIFRVGRRYCQGSGVRRSGMWDAQAGKGISRWIGICLGGKYPVATSVPVRMANPASASFRAGASLVPGARSVRFARAVPTPPKDLLR